jgi:hypothetical protein
MQPSTYHSNQYSHNVIIKKWEVCRGRHGMFAEFTTVPITTNVVSSND